MQGGFWVFGYGSLMWRPGFAYAEKHKATLLDHRRSFCLASVRYRGTPEAPGLVLGLEPMPGVNCCGVVFRVAPENAAEALEYLRERELVTRSYLEKRLPLRCFEDGRCVEAICYVIDQSHEQYRKGLSLDEQADIIARAVGPYGANAEYLFCTLEHLRELDVSDPDLEALGRRVEARMHCGTA